MAGAIRCRDAVRQLWRFLDGALEGSDRAEVEQHLAFCRRCCGELEFAKELQALLHASAAVQIPSDTRSRLDALIGELAVEPRDDDADHDDADHDGVDHDGVDGHIDRHAGGDGT